MHSPTLIKKFSLSLAALCFTTTAFSPLPKAQAQTTPEATAAGTSRPLKLAPDSPYRDPDIIYLEADELINDDAGQILTARGQVEGRYQDRTLRADEVVYNLQTGQVVATGNVVLIDATGSAQFANRLELSNALEAGSAADFTSRFENGGVIGAAFATRRTDTGVDLYNAYYTACEPCEDKKPTWQIKARRVSQNKERNMIQYRDAVFEFMGIPFFYTPYLAHPDPTVGRASGWLAPFVGASNSKGLNVRAPYYWAIDPYSELTATPRVFQRVNPLMELEYRRKFFSGEVNAHGSFTYGSYFDREGDPFTSADTFLMSNGQPATDGLPTGRRLRSHLFADGLFNISDEWDWGFGLQGATDDLYMDRYDLDPAPDKVGLYDGDSRRILSQIFAVGQNDDFRFTTSAYGFQSLRTNIREHDTLPDTFIISSEDDSLLPVIAPKIELTKYFEDPLLDGRLSLHGDVTSLTRKVGTDYTRVSGRLDWEKTAILPGGIEATPFGEVRYDYFKLSPEDAAETDFNRTLGQVGVDMRWPFIKAQDNVSFIIEPRALITQNFGDGKAAEFSTVDSNGRPVSLYQDSLGIDLDKALFWSRNKSTGFDFWQEGFRADVGGSVSALWGENNRTSLFLGQSFASDYTDNFTASSGLSGNESDLVGQFELDLGRNFSSRTLVRYDDNDDIFRRIDTSFSYRTSRFSANARYYKLNSVGGVLGLGNNIPPEELSGDVTLKLTDNWSARYKAAHDLDTDVTRTQEIALIFNDDCTKVEFIYSERNFDNDAVRNTRGFGIRFSLLTLGDFEQE